MHLFFSWNYCKAQLLDYVGRRQNILWCVSLCLKFTGFLKSKWYQMHPKVILLKSCAQTSQNVLQYYEINEQTKHKASPILKLLSSSPLGRPDTPATKSDAKIFNEKLYWYSVWGLDISLAHFPAFFCPTKIAYYIN